MLLPGTITSLESGLQIYRDLLREMCCKGHRKRYTIPEYCLVKPTLPWAVVSKEWLYLWSLMAMSGRYYIVHSTQSDFSFRWDSRLACVLLSWHFVFGCILSINRRIQLANRIVSYTVARTSFVAYSLLYFQLLEMSEYSHPVVLVDIFLRYLLYLYLLILQV